MLEPRTWTFCKSFNYISGRYGPRRGVWFVQRSSRCYINVHIVLYLRLCTSMYKFWYALYNMLFGALAFLWVLLFYHFFLCVCLVVLFTTLGLTYSTHVHVRFIVWVACNVSGVGRRKMLRLPNPKGKSSWQLLTGLIKVIMCTSEFWVMQALRARGTLICLFCLSSLVYGLAQDNPGPSYPTWVWIQQEDVQLVTKGW